MQQDKKYSIRFWLLTQGFKTIYQEIINIPTRFVRAFSWFLLIYRDRGGYPTLYKVVTKSMSEIKKEVMSKNSVVGAQKIITKIDFALLNIKLCQEDFFDSTEYKEFEAKYGWLDLVPKKKDKDSINLLQFGFTKTKQKDFEKTQKLLCKLERTHYAQCQIYRDVAFKTIAKYMVYWWN